jgi:hypothetical protein
MQHLRFRRLLLSQKHLLCQCNPQSRLSQKYLQHPRFRRLLLSQKHLLCQCNPQSRLSQKYLSRSKIIQPTLSHGWAFE